MVMKRMKLIWFLFKLVPMIFVCNELGLLNIFLIANFICKDLLSTCNTVWSTFIFCCMFIALNFLETFVVVDISTIMCSFYCIIVVFEFLQLATARPFFFSFLLFDTNLHWFIIVCRTLYITIWFIESPTQFSTIWR